MQGPPKPIVTTFNLSTHRPREIKPMTYSMADDRALAGELGGQALAAAGVRACFEKLRAK
jgi:hypothetical protein